MKGFNVDPELLEDGEHVLWACCTLKTDLGMPIAMWLFTLFGALSTLYLAYINIHSWQHFTDIWSNPEVWRVVGIFAVALTFTWVIRNWAISKGWIPIQRPDLTAQQSEYYVGLITSQRLILYSADREQDIVIRPGEVMGVKRDYSNGALALKLVLKASAPIPSVTIVTSGDLTEAKKLIESGFLSRQALDVAQ